MCFLHLFPFSKTERGHALLSSPCYSLLVVRALHWFHCHLDSVHQMQKHAWRLGISITFSAFSPLSPSLTPPPPPLARPFLSSVVAVTQGHVMLYPCLTQQHCAAFALCQTRTHCLFFSLISPERLICILTSLHDLLSELITGKQVFGWNTSSAKKKRKKEKVNLLPQLVCVVTALSYGICSALTITTFCFELLLCGCSVVVVGWMSMRRDAGGENMSILPSIFLEGIRLPL